MELDKGLLRLLLELAFRGGAGVVVSYLLKKWAWFQGLGDEGKVWISYLTTGLAGVLAFGAMVGMRYLPAPSGYVDWIETLIAAAMTSAGVAHIVYKVGKERAK